MPGVHNMMSGKLLSAGLLPVCQERLHQQHDTHRANAYTRVCHSQWEGHPPHAIAASSNQKSERRLELCQPAASLCGNGCCCCCCWPSCHSHQGTTSSDQPHCTSSQLRHTVAPNW